jgi:hypothetical protein
MRVVSDFSPSVDTLMDGLEELQKSGYRFPELTVGQKLASLKAERKALILFSDGENDASSATAKTMQAPTT